MFSTITADVSTVSRSQKALNSSPTSVLHFLAQSCQVPVAAIVDAYPPTPLQSSMFAAFLSSSSPQNPLYVARLVFTPSDAHDHAHNQGPNRSRGVDLDRFRRAWDMTIRRNEILRTRLAQGPNGKEYLVVLSEQLICHYPVGLSLAQSLEADKGLEMEYGRPLSRWTVHSEGKYFIWTVSHVLYDGWSLPLILSDFAEAWRLSSNVLPAAGEHQGLSVGMLTPRPSFKTFIKYLKRERAEKWAEAEDFWQTELSGTTEEPLQFPQIKNTRSGKEHGSMTSAVHTTSVTLPWPSSRAPSTNQLPTSSSESNSFFYSTYMWAAWAMVLWKHTGSSNVLFGVTLNGRRCPVPGIESITGPTMTTVPVMIGLDVESRVGDFLQQLQVKANRITEYSWMGIQDIMRVCGKNTGSLNSILVVQPASSGAQLEDDGNSIASISRQAGWDFDGARSTAIQHNVGICLICSPSDSGTITINLQYDPNLRTSTEIGWIAGQFIAALEQLLLTDNQTIRLGQLPMSGPQEIQQIRMWNSESIDPVDACLHDLFQSQAARRGESAAIFSLEAGPVSYQKLDVLSSDLGKSLHIKDLGPKRMIPIAFENSWLAIVAILAVLRAGACFVPIHPDTPRERVASILQQVEARILVCSETVFDVFQEHALPDDMELWALTDASLRTVSAWSQREAADMVLPKVSPSALAYTYFTSGTTGVPKGVCMSHRASCTGNTAYTRTLSLTQSSRVLQFASLSFDVSCLEIFATLIAGGCICIPSPEDRLQHLHSAIKRLGCNVVVLTPMVAKLLQADYAQDPIPIDTLCLTGEPLTAGDIEFWAPKTCLINGYGPTETCFCTFSRRLNASSRTGNIGYGSSCRTWVVEASGTRLAPLGTKGELFVEGPIVADGYLGDSQMTGELFIRDPPWLPEDESIGEAGHRIVVAYKTGDMARYNPDGSIECFGRRDAQVKVRGMRVDLGEVENAVSSLGNKAVVLFPTEGPAAGNVTAVVNFGHLQASSSSSGQLTLLPVPQPDQESQASPCITTQLLALRSHVASMIPSYMQPTVWVPIKCFPMLTSAKLSRLAVKSFITHELRDDWLSSWKKVLSSGALATRTIQPGDTLAIELAHMVNRLVGTADNRRNLGDGKHNHDLILSQAGIDSVKAIQLVRLVSKRYQVTLKVGKILGSDMSIFGLARYVEKLLNASDATICETTRYVVDLVQEYRNLTAILQDQSTSRESQPSELPDMVSTVLTTGAAGYLGIEVLHQLLMETGITKVITLVRAPSVEKALSKLKLAAERMGWSLDPHLSKIEIWLGDLSQESLGLTSAHWDRMHGNCTRHDNIDAVIHMGATVNWTRSYHQLKATNVSSTLILLNACTSALLKTGKRPHFIQISGGRAPESSFAASSSREDEALHLARELSVPTALGYTQTKFLSDILVCKWGSLYGGIHDGSVRVVMPGFIIGGGPNAVANMDDVLWRLVASNVELGMYSHKSNSSNNEEAAGNKWVYLVSSAAIARKVLHLLSKSPKPGAQEAAAIAVPALDGIPEADFWSLVSRAGYPLAGRDHKTWLAATDAAVEARGVKHPLYPILHFLMQGVGIGGEPPSEHGDAQCGCDNANREMKAEVESDVLSNLSYMRSMGFLPAAPVSSA